MKTYEPHPGEHIEHMFQEIVKRAPCNATFNGMEFTALPGDTADSLLNRYYESRGTTKEREELIASTAAEQLRRWDAGESIWSIEMGGLGPGYEQAIQVCAIEIVRDNLDRPLPVDDDREWGCSTIARIDDQLGGLSGAQVVSARQIAYRWIKDGPSKALAEAPQDRHIQVSNYWPRVSSEVKSA